MQVGDCIVSWEAHGVLHRWLPSGANAPQYCSMKQRLRGQSGFWLDVYVACTLLFLLLLTVKTTVV